MKNNLEKVKEKTTQKGGLLRGRKMTPQEMQKLKKMKMASIASVRAIKPD